MIQKKKDDGDACDLPRRAMESKKLQWRSNLRAMQIRVKERLRISCSPRAFLLRHFSAKRAYHHANKKAILGSGVSIKPLNAVLSSVLARQMNYSSSSSSSSFYGRFSAPSELDGGVQISSPTMVQSTIIGQKTGLFSNFLRDSICWYIFFKF